MIHLPREAEESRHQMILLSCYSTRLPYTNVSDDPAPDQDARRLLVGDVTLHSQRKMLRDCAGSRSARLRHTAQLRQLFHTLRDCDSFRGARDCDTLRNCDSFSRCCAIATGFGMCAIATGWPGCREAFDKGGPIPLPTTNMRKHEVDEHEQEHAGMEHEQEDNSMGNNQNRRSTKK